ncbi:hypothetical protein BZG01_18085 [Labilibaculum manganireducens]|uniref:Uncharacterized protein n=2 Tax=Labilibaculum manganireducens TaxID=1940525 RepID=A0A2N3HVR8_9BACT|nr:hypothetical protein BZG01_18085 [Labilibaculum manganireducens]
MIGNPEPKLLSQLANFRQFHFLISNRTKKPLPVMAANGHKIAAFVGIIPSQGAGRGDAVFVLEFFHFTNLIVESPMKVNILSK